MSPAVFLKPQSDGVRVVVFCCFVSKVYMVLLVFMVLHAGHVIFSYLNKKRLTEIIYVKDPMYSGGATMTAEKNQSLSTVCPIWATVETWRTCGLELLSPDLIHCGWGLHSHCSKAAAQNMVNTAAWWQSPGRHTQVHTLLLCDDFISTCICQSSNDDLKNEYFLIEMSKNDTTFVIYCWVEYVHYPTCSNLIKTDEEDWWSVTQF